jgi:hypothetical protein
MLCFDAIAWGILNAEFFNGNVLAYNFNPFTSRF